MPRCSRSSASIPASSRSGRRSESSERSSSVEALASIDRALFDAVVARRRRPLDLLFVPAAYTGAGGLPWIGLALVVRLRVRGGERLDVGRASAAILAGWAGAQAVKRITDRERPCRGGDGVALIDCPAGSSFPSDQAAAAFAGAGAIAATVPEIAAAVYAAACMTAFSRLYAGVHFPADVAGGALLGRVLGRLVGRLGCRGPRAR